MSDLRPQSGPKRNQVAVAEAHNVLLTERGSQAIVTPHRPFLVLPRGRQPDSEASRTLVMQLQRLFQQQQLEQIPLGLNRRDSQALVNERVCPR
jgi:hypothetical protein